MSASPEIEELPAEELDEYELLRAEKLSLKHRNAEYFASHPELGNIMNGLTIALLESKPSNVFEFARTYFSEAQE